MDLLERDGDSVRLTPLSQEHLTSGSPWFLGPYYESLRKRPVCQTMLTALREDRTADWHDEEWAKEMENPEFAASFTREMDCRGELEELLTGAGFTDVDYTPTTAERSIVTALL